MMQWYPQAPETAIRPTGSCYRSSIFYLLFFHVSLQQQMNTLPPSPSLRPTWTVSNLGCPHPAGRLWQALFPSAIKSCLLGEAIWSFPGSTAELNLAWKELSFITEHIQSKYMDPFPPKLFISQSHYEVHSRRQSGKTE